MLTDTQCRNAKPGAKARKLTDSKGLYLEVKVNGVKSWRYRYELVANGVRKESTFAIGNYGSAVAGETEDQRKVRLRLGCYTLVEAREVHQRARALIRQGISPVAERQQRVLKQQTDALDTVEALASDWLATKDWEEVTKSRRLNMLTRVVFPSIGKTAVRSVSSPQALAVLRRAADKNGPSVAAEAQRTLSSMYQFAISTLRAESDPIYPVRKALPKNKTQHKRALSNQEIGQLLRDLASYERNAQTVAAFQLMWMTLCRPNEILKARWDEFDFSKRIWRIPAERMKGRKEHQVPLPTQAVALLERQHAASGHLPHVFPHRDARAEAMTDSALRQALKSLGWSGRFSPHATRTTGSTRLHEHGYSSD